MTSTPLSAPRSTPAPSRLGNLRAHLAAHAETTPGRLQVLLAALVVLTLVTGTFATLTLASERSTTSQISSTTEPLLTQASTIYASLADADTTASTSFLAGGLPPAALVTRYDSDVTIAGEAIRSASALAGSDPLAAKALSTIETSFTSYTALVAKAQAENRQGYPVGDAYLSSASSLLRSEMLPQASYLLSLEKIRLSNGYHTAKAFPLVLLTALLLLATLLLLLSTQGFIRRRTNRTVNPHLATASGLVVLSLLALLVLTLVQEARLSHVQAAGSSPVVAVAQARADALQMRADEMLALASRDPANPLNKDFDQKSTGLRENLVSSLATATASTDTLSALHRAGADREAYDQAHKALHASDTGGKYDDAVKSALASTPHSAGATFTALDADLAAATAAADSSFTSLASSASSGLSALLVLFPLAALAAIVLAFLGIRNRLEEYR